MAEVRLISKFNISLPTFSEKEDDDAGRGDGAGEAEAGDGR